jgi:hypothetical protein
MPNQPGLPMSFARYELSVAKGTPLRAWIGPLRKAHGLEIHTRAEWAALIEKLKTQPISFENLSRPAGR